jgi:protein-tyrosine-phosphatase
MEDLDDLEDMDDDSDIDDPYRRGESAFRRALEDIEKGVDAWTGYLTQ